MDLCVVGLLRAKAQEIMLVSATFHFRGVTSRLPPSFSKWVSRRAEAEKSLSAHRPFMPLIVAFANHSDFGWLIPLVLISCEVCIRHSLTIEGNTKCKRPFY